MLHKEYNNTNEVNMIKECTVNELKDKIDSNSNATLIDCREQDEWDAAHIEGVKLMPLSKFENHFLASLSDKEAEIIIHCRSGARSLNLCQYLSTHGFTNLTNVRGGIMAWINNGFPTEGNQ